VKVPSGEAPSGEAPSGEAPSLETLGAGPRMRRALWPSVSHLILTAVCSCRARKRASFPFIKKMLATKGYNVLRNCSHLKAAVLHMLSKGLLRQVTGSGLTGSFRLGRVGEERPDGKTKGPRRAVKATARRLKTSRPRGKAVAAGGLEEKSGLDHRHMHPKMAPSGKGKGGARMPVAGIGRKTSRREAVGVTGKGRGA
uniref:H15 domain-containing protein n=1 Tax=Accipiter nisus TaxID=211598 RepID=A0A8B9RU74_9AVES